MSVKRFTVFIALSLFVTISGYAQNQTTNQNNKQSLGISLFTGQDPDPNLGPGLSCLNSQNPNWAAELKIENEQQRRDFLAYISSKHDGPWPDPPPCPPACYSDIEESPGVPGSILSQANSRVDNHFRANRITEITSGRSWVASLGVGLSPFSFSNEKLDFDIKLATGVFFMGDPPSNLQSNQLAIDRFTSPLVTAGVQFSYDILHLSFNSTTRTTTIAIVGETRYSVATGKPKYIDADQITYTGQAGSLKWVEFNVGIATTFGY